MITVFPGHAGKEERSEKWEKLSSSSTTEKTSKDMTKP
ncbi:unnamed protein product [Haemonchus placei]|uniref:Uncharacterized protein n=1 Tax=Haemonchus placei TaxID=6290 RepID=A0A0N4WSW1_HAEPC|nr:unnamed protein product [Haemonchus placei]